jgi:hypothetical protein
MDIYVSKLGDNSTGHSWQTAFHTLQQGLLAVPDDRGGHRVLVRPDTYVEANLYTARQGVKGAYNEFVGDVDGRLGSGATGWVVIDSGDPALGFKSYDWWGPIRSYSNGWSKAHTGETFSATCWDRWALRHLYATGSDAGLFFDGTDQVRPFSVLVEDCVCIGRAFGGGVASVLSRADEPITFRRCHLWALDYIGDTAAAYLRVENQSMPAQPDVVLEDCVMAAPQACVKSTNFSFFTYTWTRLIRCQLIQLNFSQPEMAGPAGSPPAGIVTSVQRGDRMKVSFDDCLLMGYRMFGVMVETETAKDIQYETTGDCRAYVQFKQDVPAGFRRLGRWPVEAFQRLLPPLSQAEGNLR